MTSFQPSPGPSKKKKKKKKKKFFNMGSYGVDPRANNPGHLYYNKE